jgi:predicted transcriptional regulator
MGLNWAWVFETGGDRNYFMTILAAHPEALVSEQVSEQVIQILEFCRTEQKKQEILNYLNLSPAYRNYKRHILPLLQNELLAFTIPDKPKSRLQKYKITESGLAALKRPAGTGKNDDESLAVHPEARVSEQVSEQVIQILEFCKTERKKQEILNYLNLSPAYTNYKRYILPLLQNGLLAFTIPDKPRSRSQKYKITESGLAA